MQNKLYTQSLTGPPGVPPTVTRGHGRANGPGPPNRGPGGCCCSSWPRAVFPSQVVCAVAASEVGFGAGSAAEGASEVSCQCPGNQPNPGPRPPAAAPSGLSGGAKARLVRDVYVIIGTVTCREVPVPVAALGHFNSTEVGDNLKRRTYYRYCNADLGVLRSLSVLCFKIVLQHISVPSARPVWPAQAQVTTGM